MANENENTVELDNMVFTTFNELEDITAMEYVPQTKRALIFNYVWMPLLRVQNIYTDYQVLPTFVREIGDNGEITGFMKETREFDMVLPFGDGVSAPRRKPLEILYNGRKLKNSFLSEDSE